MSYKCGQAVSAVVVFLIVMKAVATSHSHGTSLFHQKFRNNSTAIGENLPCRPWTIRQENGSCTCGKGQASIVKCDNYSVSLLACYCMTYTNGTGVIGHCLTGCGPANSGVIYQLLPNSISELQNTTCTQYNREGQMCGKCIDGFAVPAYSYQWTCVKCSEEENNWLKYFSVAFLPLTLFFILVLAFRINVTSAPIHGFILVSQIISCPEQLRVLLIHQHETLGIRMDYYAILSSAYGIWYLDFFRLVYKPFCLYPNMTMLEAVALDYLVAVYPLALIVLTYFLVKLHDYNFRPIVWLWKPVHWFMARFRRQFDIQTSLIDAFATFFVLSYWKFASISFDILLPTYLFGTDGKTLAHTYLYYDGTVEYFGSTHMPFALLAFAVLLIFVAFPVLVIVLYQFRCIHRRAVCHHLMGNSLHMFMDAIQGGYKDGTNGTRDCRYFPLVYLLLRILLLVIYAITLDGTTYILGGVTLIATLIAISLLSPYKVTFYNYLDVFLLGSVVLTYQFIAVSGRAHVNNSTGLATVSEVLVLIFAVIPLIYMSGYMLYQIIGQTRLAQISATLKLLFGRCNTPQELEASLPHRLTHADEYTPLLIPVSGNRNGER